MKIVIAPDSFKESLTAQEVCHAIKQGFESVLPEAEYCSVPMADGGEGTVQSLVDGTSGEIIPVSVTGPLAEPVEAHFGLMGDGTTAVIEMAAASGLHLVPNSKRNPMLTTSYGTGELILAALNRGARRFVIGIGGSATNDGGAGMAQALGARLLDEDGEAIGFGGAELARLASIDLSEMDTRLTESVIEVACDVDNPLCGERGASAVFGPQKGATPEMIRQLDNNLGHYGALIQQQLGVEVMSVPGAGAAGGMGAALLGLFGAKLRSGVEIVMDTIELALVIEDADLVITGEGRIDGQTVFGKAPYGVATLAKRNQKPVIAIAGSLGDGHQVVYQHGLDAVFSVVPGAVTLDQALESAFNNVVDTARNVAATLRLGADQVLGTRL